MIAVFVYIGGITVLLVGIYGFVSMVSRIAS